MYNGMYIIYLKLKNRNCSFGKKMYTTRIVIYYLEPPNVEFVIFRLDGVSNNPVYVLEVNHLIKYKCILFDL